MHNLVLSPISTDDLVERIAERTAELLNSTKQRQDSVLQQNDIITRKETLKLLNVSSSTLWLYEKEGKIKGYGVKGKRYYKRSEILSSLIEKK